MNDLEEFGVHGNSDDALTEFYFHLLENDMGYFLNAIEKGEAVPICQFKIMILED